MSNTPKATLGSLREFFASGPGAVKLSMDELKGVGVVARSEMQEQLAVEAKAANFQGLYQCVEVK